MLVYRGETMGLGEPAASIRLKGLRRGSQDYEYFWLLSQPKGGREIVDEAVSTMLHGSIGDSFSGSTGHVAPTLRRVGPDAREVLGGDRKDVESLLITPEKPPPAVEGGVCANRKILTIF